MTSRPRRSAASYTDDGARCAFTRTTSSPTSTMARTCSSHSASSTFAMNGPRGNRLVPLRCRRSPLIEHTQSSHATSRTPVRRCAEWLTTLSTTTSTPMSTSSAGPIRCGHHNRGCSRSRLHATSFTPAARATLSSSMAMPPTEVRMMTVRPWSVSRRDRNNKCARESSASRVSTRSRSRRTGPVSSMCTPPMRPPGVDGWAEDTP